MDNAGSVRFTPAPHNRGTEVKIVTSYAPPAGKAAGAVATSSVEAATARFERVYVAAQSCCRRLQDVERQSRRLHEDRALSQSMTRES